MLVEKLNPTDLRSFLERHLDEPVVYSIDESTCPIDEYFHIMHNIRVRTGWYSVGLRENIYEDLYETGEPLPRWAAQFIDHVDTHKNRRGLALGEWWQHITGRECLEALDQALKETQQEKENVKPTTTAS